MIYFTKEFAQLEFVADLDKIIRVNKRAELRDEEFYKQCYESKFAAFKRNEQAADWYADDSRQLKEYDEYINEPNISERERESRRAIKEGYLYIRKKQNNKTFKFDKKLCRLKFDERQNFIIENCKILPEEILIRIADIRVFALGYASADVKALLCPYCEKIRKQLFETRCKAVAATEHIISHRKKPFDYADFDSTLFYRITDAGDILYVSCEDVRLRIKNGMITEGKGHPVHPYDDSRPNRPYSVILHAELHTYMSRYELHFLVCNYDAIERKEYWYLTIRCDDFIKVPVEEI